MELSQIQKTILSKISVDFSDMKSIAERVGMQAPSVRVHVRELEKHGLVVCKKPKQPGSPLLVRNPLGRKSLVFKGILSHQIW